MTTGTPASGRQRLQQLTDGYLAASPRSAGSLFVVVDAAQVQARSQILQSKLAAVGIVDVTQQGSLLLGGSVRITPGLREGVAGLPDLDPTATLDLDTLPEFFTYTTASSSTAGSGARLAPSQDPQAAQAMAMRDLRMKKAPELDVDEALMTGKSLTFQDGTEIVIAADVRYLTMLAPRIVVGKNVTIRWEQPTPADRGTAAPGTDGTPYVRNQVSAVSAFHSPSGGDGGPGGDTDPGYPGDDAPTLEIWALDLNRLFTVHLSGVRGGTGQHGGRGGAGGNGAKGADSHANLVECVYGPGFGGDGGDGGPGSRGGRGGPGGRGGYLNLYLADASHDAVLAVGFSDNRGPGDGGDGGDGGPGGPKGLAGEAGDPKGVWCLAAPERVGLDGKDGADGSDGGQGKDGPDGRLTAIVITEDDFRQTWTSPQLRRVSPSTVEVGDQITIDGANFSTTSAVTVAGVPAKTTVISDTLLQAKVPAVPSGWADVLVSEPSGRHSNPGSVQVLATLRKVTPNPAAIGDTITLLGKGFQPHSRVLFRGTELVPDQVAADGETVIVTLPKPQGAFEDPGGVEELAVRNPDGSTTGSISLTLRPVLSTGFDVARNGYAFENGPTLQALADLGTFEDTYGVTEVSLEFWLDWKGTGAWYLFYLHFFNDLKPGYSSGFSTTAADEYWSGNPNLSSDYATLPERERFLTVAQGHVLSQEMLLLLATQAAAGLARAETSLNEVEAAFRRQLTSPADKRREIAPIMQLMPAGTLLTGGFKKKLGESHGLLPIRVEYPVDGEEWERRLIVYDNATDVGTESTIEFTRSSRGLEFELSPDDYARTSRNGWTLSQASLDLNWLSDATLPLDYVFLIASASLLITDDQGRRYGTAGGGAWTDIPDVTAATIAPNVYLLPLDRSLTFTVDGEADGSYTLAVVAGSAGRSLVLQDVPMSIATKDVIGIDETLSRISVSTREDKELSLSYAVVGARRARGLTVSGMRASTQGDVVLEVRGALAGFQLTPVGSDQPAAAEPLAVEPIAAEPAAVGLITVELIAADADQTVRRQRFDPVDLGGGAQSFRVADWSKLGPDSLQPDQTD